MRVTRAAVAFPGDERHENIRFVVASACEYDLTWGPGLFKPDTRVSSALDWVDQGMIMDEVFLTGWCKMMGVGLRGAMSRSPLAPSRHTVEFPVRPGGALAVEAGSTANGSTDGAGASTGAAGQDCSSDGSSLRSEEIAHGILQLFLLALLLSLVYVYQRIRRLVHGSAPTSRQSPAHAQHRQMTMSFGEEGDSMSTAI